MDRPQPIPSSASTNVQANGVVQTTRRKLYSLFRFFNGVAVLCTITHFVVIYAKPNYLYSFVETNNLQDQQINLSLCIISLFLCSALILLWMSFSRILFKLYPEGYETIESFVRYNADSGTDASFELYKKIRIKKLVMLYYSHPFYWTGASLPRASSENQDAKYIQNKEIGGYDTIRLKLDRPSIYDEIKQIHVRTDVGIPDDQPDMHITLKVTEPTQMLRWDVILQYKAKAGDAKPAILERKEIKPDTYQSYETIREVPFDPSTKSYREGIVDPAIGFYYKLTWER